MPLIDLKQLNAAGKQHTPRVTTTAAPAYDRPSDEAARIREVYGRRHAGNRYDWDQPGQLFMMQELERRLLSALRQHHCLPLRDRRILEVGCGSGHFLRELIKWGADPAKLVGIDLLEDRLIEGRRRMPAGPRLEARDAADTGFPDASFDLVLQMTMFTSILSPTLRQRVASEMLRVLAPGGWIVWYDLRVNNPRNRDVRAVRKAEIRALFPGRVVHLQAATLAPPLARSLAPRAWWLCALLARLPFLRSHYLGLIGPHAMEPAGTGPYEAVLHHAPPRLRQEHSHA